MMGLRHMIRNVIEAFHAAARPGPPIPPYNPDLTPDDVKAHMIQEREELNRSIRELQAEIALDIREKARDQYYGPEQRHV